MSLKIYAGFYIMEHKDLSSKDKRKLLNFVNESDDIQVMNFLLSGKADKKINKELVESKLAYALYEVVNPDSVSVAETINKKIDEIHDRMKSVIQNIKDAYTQRNEYIQKARSDGKALEQAVIKKFDEYITHYKTKQDELFKEIDKLKLSSSEFKDKAKDTQEEIFKKVHDNFDELPNEIKWLGGLAIAALASYTTFKIYKKYMESSERVCKGSSNKMECEKKHRTESLVKSRHILIKTANMCYKSKEPDKCRQYMNEKIKSYDKRISSSKKI